MTSDVLQETLWSKLVDCQTKVAHLRLDTRESRPKLIAGV